MKYLFELSKLILLVLVLKEVYAESGLATLTILVLLMVDSIVGKYRTDSMAQLISKLTDSIVKLSEVIFKEPK